MKTEKVALGFLRYSTEVQHRAQMSKNVVDAMTTDIMNGAQMPPLDVFYDGKVHWIADGMHRYHAFVEYSHLVDNNESVIHVVCNIYTGTKEDAVWFGLGCNTKHKAVATLTKADKMRKVELGMRHSNASGRSEKERLQKVAEQTKIPYGTVNDYWYGGGLKEKSIKSTFSDPRTSNLIEDSMGRTQPAQKSGSRFDEMASEPTITCPPKEEERPPNDVDEARASHKAIAEKSAKKTADKMKAVYAFARAYDALDEAQRELSKEFTEAQLSQSDGGIFHSLDAKIVFIATALNGLKMTHSCLHGESNGFDTTIEEALES